jgi:serine/threonine-protein kinase
VKLKELFLDLRERSAEAREEALRRMAAEDPEAVERLRAWLAADDPAFLAPLCADPPPVFGGRYRVVRELGRGGMGVVYLAERIGADFPQRVAIKSLPWRSDPAAEARLARERRILARLQHPRIARLLDGGTEDGRPWLAMEYVEGIPFDRALAGRPLRERLLLWLKVAEAVAHAHAALVVHRDLKPGNILVDAAGEPHLLDFGVAGLLESGGDLTGWHGLPFTPRYASPEQIRGEPASTAADVFALGVLLYEAVTDAWPFGSEQDPGQQMRAVLSAPVRPFPGRALRDLLAICERALAKDARERYSSVESLVADLRAFLEGRPVTARRAGLAYRTGKWLRRHRWMVATSALLVALAAGAVLYHLQSLATQLERVKAERAKAEALAGFFVSLFEEVDPAKISAGVSARELLAQSAERLLAGQEAELALAARAELLQAVGAIYTRLDLNGEAERVFREAVRLRRESGSDPEGLALALNGLAVVLQRRGAHREAEGLVAEAIALRRSIGDVDSLRFANLLNSQAILLDLLGDREQARERFAEAERLYRRLWPAGRREFAGLLGNRATQAMLAGDFALCRGLVDEALAALADEDDPLRRIALLERRGRCRMAEGDLSGAGQDLAAAAAVAERALPPEHRRHAAAAIAEAQWAASVGEPERALRRLATFASVSLPADLAAEAVLARAAALLIQGRFAEVETTLDTLPSDLAGEHPEARALRMVSRHCTRKDAPSRAAADEALAAWEAPTFNAWRRERLHAALAACAPSAQPN